MLCKNLNKKLNIFCIILLVRVLNYHKNQNQIQIFNDCLLDFVMFIIYWVGVRVGGGGGGKGVWCGVGLKKNVF